MWATICTFLSHNNISTQKTHRFTCTPHNIHELTLTKAQACTHTAYAQHSHGSLSYTHRHISAQIPVSIYKELGHLCRAGDLWHSLISNLDTEPGPPRAYCLLKLRPTSSCSVNCFCQRLPSSSCLECHPSEVAWG